jgi:hypothetical protein
VTPKGTYGVSAPTCRKPGRDPDPRPRRRITPDHIVPHFAETSAHAAAGSVSRESIWAHGAVMSVFFSSPASTGPAVPSLDPLKLAVGAYLGRFKGSCREHSGSDLRVFLTWCRELGVHPLAAHRADLELYVRWMQETRRFKPSTVSRRISVLAGFYRTCVIDGLLAHSPAEHVRRPTVPVDSPTLGLTHQWCAS